MMTISVDQPEEWRPVVGFPGYEVSNLAGVRSRLPSRRHGAKTSVPHVTMVHASKKDGYVRVPLIRDGKKHSRYLHRMVLEAFVGPCPPGWEGCHDDGVRANCVLGNLCWGTKKRNAADRDRHGRTPRGEQKKNAKLTELKVQNILDTDRPHKELAAENGVHKSLISLVKARKIWPHITQRQSDAS